MKLKLRFFDLYNVQLILFNHTLIKPIETSLQAGLCLAVPHHQSLWKDVYILLLEKVINSVCLSGCGFLRQYLLLQVEIIYCFIHFTVCIKFKKWNNNTYANSTICHALKKGEEIHALLWEIKPFCFSTIRYTAELFMIWWNTNHFFTERWIFEWFPQILFSLKMAANKRIAYYRNIYF